MKVSKYTKSAALALGLSFFSLWGQNAIAQEAEMFMKMRSVEMMDTNKDGKVSRAEFVNMAGKMFDMKVKSMGIKDGKMDANQLKELYKDLYAGGN